MSGHDATRRKAVQIRRWRRVHEWTGLIAAIWLALTALSGIALNHAETWGLLDTHLPNRWLPSSYTDEFHPDTTMLNTVMTDIHSGRIFGAAGPWLADIGGAALLVSIISGCYTYLQARKSNPAR